jgi:uncharacterized protein
MRVASLHRWPVKSMAGDDLPALDLDAGGAPGDRAHAVVDVHRDKLLTAREAPRLLAWRARYEGARVVLTAPDGAERGWDDDDMAQALADDLGRAVGLRHDPQGMQDLGCTVLVTFEATVRALPGWRDLRRFRPNLHLDGDAPAFAEEGWEGRRLHVGDAVELELLHPCERCAIPTRDPDTQRKDAGLLRWLAREHDTLFGINARVLAPGTVRVGDAVG